MRRKKVSGIMLILLLIGMLILTFNIQPVKASGTIYIRADGSIEGTTNISTVDNVSYTFTGNIHESIVVERDNIVVDGAGYTLQGRRGTGIDLTERSNVTIKNMRIEAFAWCIRLEYSSNNTIYHNNFINNTQQVYDYSWSETIVPPSINVWDDSYPSGGNYWSDHVCTGNPSDGSQPYVIDADNIDHYPFQDPNGWLLPPAKKEEPFPIWIVAAIVIIAVAGAALLVYFTKVKKPTEKVK